MPRYDHIFVIVEENRSFDTVIDNPDTKTINTLARTFGLASAYYGVSHPSEGNYVALIGGSSFGIDNDGPYAVNTIAGPSLVDQLQQARLTWRGYFQSLPQPGFLGECVPVDCGGAPNGDPIYASKHNPFLNFSRIRKDAARLAQLVPDTQLKTDIREAHVPNFGLIVPDECHDMHGASPPLCGASSQRLEDTHRLLRQADEYVDDVVTELTSAPWWKRGRNAIVITSDEADGDSAGCCGTDPAGGHVLTVVVTSKGPRGMVDDTPYNHYSLLRTMQLALGLPCLELSCDESASLMTPLFR